jgi:outer membrane protein
MNLKSINQKNIFYKTLRTLITTSILFSFLAASSQGHEWTLEECINYALSNNIDIKKQVLSVENQKDQLLQSKLGMLPSLNAGATHGYNWGRAVDRYTNTFANTRIQSNNFYLGTQFNLFQGLQQINNMNKSKLDWLATQYDLDLLMDNISIAVAGYYLDILYNKEIYRVAGDQLDVTKLQVNRMQKMVEAGTMARGDLLNIQAQAATEESQLVQAENNLILSYLTLQQLIDLPVTDTFQIEIPELRQIEVPEVVLKPQDVYQMALTKRPEIKSAEYRAMSAQKDISYAYGYLSPILSFNGSWATGYSGASTVGSDLVQKVYENAGYVQNTLEPVALVNSEYSTYSVIPFNDQLNDNQNKTLTLSLQIPIYNGWQAQTAISQAKIRKEEADLTLQKAKLDLNQTIQKAYADAVAALKNYNASEKKLQAQKEAFKYSEQKLGVGLVTTVQYNETKKELTRAESDMLQAKYRFIYTTTVLDFYMGNPITLK